MNKLRIEHFFLSLVALLLAVGGFIFSGTFIQQANVVTTTKDARLLTVGSGVSINDVLLSFRLHEGEMRDLLNRAADFHSSRQVSDYIDEVTTIYTVLLDQVSALYNAPFESVMEMRELLSNIDDFRDRAVDAMHDDHFFFADDLVRDLNRMNRRMDDKSSSIQELLLLLNPLAFQSSPSFWNGQSNTSLKESRLQGTTDPVSFVLANNLMALKPDGLFHNDDYVTRIELFNALTQTLRVDLTQEAANTDADALYAYVSRAQGLYVVMQAYGLPVYPSELPQTFLDVLPELNFIELGRQIGLIGGVTPTLFAPDQPLTRYELAAMLMRASALSII